MICVLFDCSIVVKMGHTAVVGRAVRRTRTQDRFIPCGTSGKEKIILQRKIQGIEKKP